MANFRWSLPLVITEPVIVWRLNSSIRSISEITTAGSAFSGNRRFYSSSPAGPNVLQCIAPHDEFTVPFSHGGLTLPIAFAYYGVELASSDVNAMILADQ